MRCPSRRGASSRRATTRSGPSSRSPRRTSGDRCWPDPPPLHLQGEPPHAGPCLGWMHGWGMARAAGPAASVVRRRHGVGAGACGPGPRVPERRPARARLPHHGIARRRAAAQHRRARRRRGLVALAARRGRRGHRPARLAEAPAAARGRTALPAPLRLRPAHAVGRDVGAVAGRLLRRALHRGRLGARPPRHDRRRRLRAAADVRLADLAVRGRQRHRAGARDGRPTAAAPGPLLPHERLRHLHPAHQRRLLRRRRHRGPGRLALGPAARAPGRAGPHHRRAGHLAAASGRRRGAAAHRPRAARRRRTPRVRHRHPGRRGATGAAPRPRDGRALAAHHRDVVARGGGTDAGPAGHPPERRHRGRRSPGRPSPGSPTSPHSPARAPAPACPRRAASSRTAPARWPRCPGPSACRSTAPRRRPSPTCAVTRRHLRQCRRARRPPARARLRARLRRGRGARRRPAQIRHVRLRPGAARRPGAPVDARRDQRDRAPGDRRLPCARADAVARGEP